MDQIFLLVASIVFFFLGRYSVSKQDIEQANRAIRSLKRLDVGIVKRPTQEELDARTPLGKKLKETEDAMEETLKKFL